jgi:putative PIG3 family NAD(P)H quinone oxidoreductase
MRAAVYTAAGDVDVIRIEHRPDPEPGPRQVRVRVRASALNRADLLQRRGRYAAPPGWPADIPGLEYAGEVDALGPDVARWGVGDQVMGLVGGGGQAERLVVHEDEAMPVPLGLTLTEAAAIPEAFLTAYDALVTRGQLRSAERVLIHAVASGVGTAAAQIAHRLGATVLGTSRSAAKLARAREYGLDLGIDTASASFRDVVREPVDLILDVLGGAAFADNLAVLGLHGRLVMLGFLTGSRVDADLDVVLRKRLSIVGTVMRTRSLPERALLAQEFAERMLPLFVRREGEPAALRPVVGLVLPMAELADAHRAMEANETFGKVVLVWS